MQHHAKIMSCHAKIVQNESENRVKSSRPYLHVWPRMRARAKKTGPVKKEWQVGRDNNSRSRRPRTAAPGLARGGWCRRAEPTARPGGLRAALARGRAADPGGPALLLPPGPAAFQQGLRLQPAPRPRGAQRLHPSPQRAEEARA